MEIDNRVAYCKPPKTIDEQIALLELRGLIVPDRKKLEGYLKNISYYHLSSYFKSFQDSTDVFDDKVTFDQVLNVYEFDKKLRLLMLDVIERIEKSFKCRLISSISLETSDSHWHCNICSYASKELFDRYILDRLEKSKDSTVTDYKKYYSKYNSPEYPPAWTFFESLSFGEIVNFYRNLNAENKKIVAKTFDLQNEYVTSWMYGLSEVRNISAHHARLWNVRLTANLKTYHIEYVHLFNLKQFAYVYNFLLVAHIFMQKINPTSTWLIKLENIINEHEIDVVHMGFPADWQDRFLEVSIKHSS